MSPDGHAGGIGNLCGFSDVTESSEGSQEGRLPEAAHLRFLFGVWLVVHVQGL